jgi:uncharacterized protein YndB with AHSA1/START domain
MSADTVTAVRVVQHFSAPADRIFDAWTDPAIAPRWLFATAWRPAMRADIDARAGGAFRIVERKSRREIEHNGAFLELARPRRLAFTLSDGGQPSRVTVEIVPLAAGCELSLVHEGLPPGEAESVEGRWAGMLYGLETILSNVKEIR